MTQLLYLLCKQGRSWVSDKGGSPSTTVQPCWCTRSREPQGTELSPVMPTSKLQVWSSLYLAEAGEEGLVAGQAAPLLDVVTVLEEDT